jgi:hypothetical protein
MEFEALKHSNHGLFSQMKTTIVDLIYSNKLCFLATDFLILHFKITEEAGTKTHKDTELS